MKAIFIICFIGIVRGAHHHTNAPPTTTIDPNSDEGRLQFLEKTMGSLARQMMLQQLYVEERIRSDGDSGVKQVRHNHDGTRTFLTDTHAGNSINSIHDHTNYKTTVGMGEVIAVLNGVEFRTRHNDYKLRMPSRTSTNYHAMEYIPFPDVPPSVLAKHTVSEQVEEMRNYFKAWKYQNHQYRDYRPYFKPVLCYMEGAWTTNTKSLDEPFQSDRHFIDAESWFDLQDKVRYTSYTGGKSNLENFSYLPSTIMNIHNNTPEFAQWNYRILCHPLKDDLPLKHFEPIDDIALRLTKKYNMTKFSKTRACRFNLAAYDSGSSYDADKGYGTIRDKQFNHGILDSIMNEIPGKNNYKANMTDHSFGMTVLNPLVADMVPLNTAYYHRLYKYDKKGAMGTVRSRRGYADHSLYVAQTTQQQVSNMIVKHCEKPPHSHVKNCTNFEARYTYAIPLEIIYLTPLHSWNPYNLQYKSSDYEVYKGGRNGGFNSTTAYNGISNKFYYMTPTEFFSGKEVNHDKADTVKRAVGVLDRQGAIRSVAASGTRILFPNINGIGTLRQRWPISPLHQEGNSVYKELDALKEIVNHMPAYSSFFQEAPNANANTDTHKPDGHFRTSFTTRDPPGRHHHEVFIDATDMESAVNGLTVKATTSVDNQHSHDLDISFDKSSGKWIIVKCDGLAHCWDGHDNSLTQVQ